MWLFLSSRTLVIQLLKQSLKFEFHYCGRYISYFQSQTERMDPGTGPQTHNRFNHDSSIQFFLFLIIIQRQNTCPHYTTTNFLFPLSKPDNSNGSISRLYTRVLSQAQAKVLELIRILTSKIKQQKSVTMQSSIIHPNYN